MPSRTEVPIVARIVPPGLAVPRTVRVVLDLVRRGPRPEQPPRSALDAPSIATNGETVPAR